MATWGKLNSRSIGLNADFENVRTKQHSHGGENYVYVNTRFTALDGARKANSVMLRNIDVSNHDAHQILLSHNCVLDGEQNFTSSSSELYSTRAQL